ncbi:hypothetical protein AA12717_3729 [Gluconacetobacter sacchari DSM 12717]|uniref:Uncharacterized protein n=2 Tax=Gluconacetobacter sacchari TaxID=92759 RepID=A0A7W4I9W1_9PROT|nr:hypothetical protein [Gluconacetobacter sacchari]MBB2158965.1 hypothetical protein [Gluconacetobacter sacchari]GBQ31330.1 hypothetical protein AA12717_3729 [Gluconacetobacter sacchari DSM 12717]
MSFNEDDILKQTYRRHFQKVSDADVGFADTAPADLFSPQQAQKERADERYSLHFMVKTKGHETESRQDYEALFSMPADRLQKEIDDRMFSAKPGEPFPSRAHLRALAVGDARGITDTWRQDKAASDTRIPETATNVQVPTRQDSSGRQQAQGAKQRASVLPPRPGIPYRPIAGARKTSLERQIDMADRAYASHQTDQRNEKRAVTR